MKHIAKSLKESLVKAGLYQGIKSVKVLELWPKVVGEKIASKTEASDIKNGIIQEISRLGSNEEYKLNALAAAIKLVRSQEPDCRI